MTSTDYGPETCLIVGICSLAAAIVFSRTGRVWNRFSRWIYRSKEPGWYWWNLFLFYLGGVFFIGLYLSIKDQ